MNHAQKQALRALRMHQRKQADRLPDNTTMWAFMATGAFDPPTLDEIACDQDEINATIADAMRRAQRSDS